MGKIPEPLHHSARQNPKTRYQVLMVLQSGCDPTGLGLGDYRILMDTILSLSLAGEEILRLADSPQVLSIEPDEPMSALGKGI